MKKFIELIRTKERDEKAPTNVKKANPRDEKAILTAPSNNQPIEQRPQDIFWDDYSDVGYC